MTRYGHFIRLAVLISMIIMGLFLTALVSALLLLLSGSSLEDLMEMGRQGTGSFSPGVTRLLLLAQHLLTFIFPGLLFGYIFYRPKTFSGLDLDQKPLWISAIFGVMFLMVAYPLVNLSFQFNELIPLPSWALDFEDQAEETLKAILQMDHPGVFMANLLTIAILPGIGEELIFRGIIQKETGKILKSPLLAIWVTGFIFSAIHLQFEGFLPRMVLGVALGYLYYWTKNLWVPIIAHMFNNGIQVALIYFAGMDITEIDKQGTGPLAWWMFPVCIGIMYWLSQNLIKNQTRGDTV